MYKFLTTVLISFFLISNAAAQTGVWKSIITPNGIASGFSTMIFTTDTIGYIYGETQGIPFDLERTIDSGVDFNLLTWPKPIDTFHVDTNGHSFLVFSSDKAIQLVNDMAWPSPDNGILVGPTYSDTFQTSTQTVLVTQDAGSTWKQYYPVDNDTVIKKADTVIVNKDTTITPADTIVNHEFWNNIYFPSDLVGYASTSLADGSKDYIAKTTDGGETWINKYQSDSLTFKNLYFRDPNNGIFFAQGISLHVGYTTDGGNTFKLTSVGTDSTPYFLHWNNDNSWLVGADSVYRSVDSGKNWKGVVPYDTLAGSATVGTFYDSVGFVFRGIEAKVLETTDYGVTWTSSTLPLPAGGTKADTVTPVAASMPSPRVAYLLAYDGNNTTDVMMQIEIPQPTVNPPPGGVASLVPQNEISFTVYSDNSSLNFEVSPPAPEQRTIEVMDLLGRQCASIPMQSNATSSRLAMSALPPGSYFARLGTSVVKFNIWE